MLPMIAVIAGLSVVLLPDKPVKGWNSYDFGNGTPTYGTPDYSTLLNLMDGMQQYLLPYGYNYFCVDGGWSGNGSQHDMDEFARPTPLPSVYPTLKGSWKPVSDAVHSRGLKMGLWVTLGIPTQAAIDKTPIKDTPYTAADILYGGEVNYACGWNADVAKLNTSHPGTEAYYRSLVEQWDGWELDYVTIDCVFGANYAPDNLAIFKRVIEESSREYIVSLSPGDGVTADQLTSVRDNGIATQARITTDFYANWHQTYAHFPAAAQYAPLAGGDKRFYVNMDKLPFGKMHGQVELPKQWPFWPPCQKTIFTLWVTVQSPLMYGGDIRNPASCDPKSPYPCGVSNYTIGLLNNEFLLEAHGDIRHPRQIYADDFTIIWMAESATYGDQARYVSIFNVLCGIPHKADPPCLNQTITSTVSFSTLGLSGSVAYDLMDLTEKTPLPVATGSFVVSVEGLSAKMLRVTPSVVP